MATPNGKAAPIKMEPIHVLQNSQFKEFERNANAAADIIALNEDLTSSFNHGIKTAFENMVSVNAIHFDLFTTEGLTPEMVATWPEVGSYEGHTGNKPFDVFAYKTLDGTKARTSFFRLMAERHPIGADIKSRLRKLVDGQAGRQDLSGVYKTQKTGIEREFTTFFGKLKLAVELYQKMTRANEELGKVLKVSYERKAVLDANGAPVIGEDGKVKTEIATRAVNLIVVTDLSRDGVAERFTTANFCRLDVDLAKAAGGTYGAFTKSNRRETPDNEQPKPELAVDTNAAFEDATRKTLQYINGVKANPARLRDLVAFYSNEGSDDRLQSLEYLHDGLSVILGLPHIKARLEALNMGTANPEVKAA